MKTIILRDDYKNLEKFLGNKLKIRCIIRAGFKKQFLSDKEINYNIIINLKKPLMEKVLNPLRQRSGEYSYFDECIITGVLNKKNNTYYLDNVNKVVLLDNEGPNDKSNLKKNT